MEVLEWKTRQLISKAKTYIEENYNVEKYESSSVDKTMKRMTDILLGAGVAGSAIGLTTLAAGHMLNNNILTQTGIVAASIGFPAAILCVASLLSDFKISDTLNDLSRKYRRELSISPVKGYLVVLNNNYKSVVVSRLEVAKMIEDKTFNDHYRGIYDLESNPTFKNYKLIDTKTISTPEVLELSYLRESVSLDSEDDNSRYIEKDKEREVLHKLKTVYIHGFIDAKTTEEAKEKWAKYKNEDLYMYSNEIDSKFILNKIKKASKNAEENRAELPNSELLLSTASFQNKKF